MSYSGKTGSSNNSSNLLMLFSMPRSGSSWLGKILDSHPQTLYKHEPDSGRLHMPLAPDPSSAEEHRPVIETFVKELGPLCDARVSSRLPVFPKAYRSPVAQFIHKTSVVSSIALSPLMHRFPVLQCANPKKPGIQVVWKSIVSLGRLGVILRVVPESRAIHIVRHPCGYVCSVLRGEAQRKFAGNVPTSEHYNSFRMLLDAHGARTHGLTLDHLRDCHPVERMTWMWVLMNEKAERDNRANPRCLMFRYEDLCNSPEAKTQDLFSFLGLDWNEQTAAFLRMSTKVEEAGAFDRMTQAERRYYSIFKNPIKAANRWKSEMKDEDIRRVYGVLAHSDLRDLYPESEMDREVAPAVPSGIAIAQTG